MTDDKTDAGFWLRGAAEIIAGLGQEPDPDVDIRRIEEVFGVPFPPNPYSPTSMTARAVMAGDLRVRCSYSLPPMSRLTLLFSNSQGPTAPATEIDAQDFCARLVGRGFIQKPWYGEHGRWMGFILGSDRLRCGISTARSPEGREFVEEIRVSWLPS